MTHLALIPGVALLFALLPVAPPAEAGLAAGGPPDLTVSIVVASPGPYFTSQEIEVGFQVLNNGGNIPNGQSTVLRVRLPAGAAAPNIPPDCNLVLQDMTCPIGPLAHGGFFAGNVFVLTPERRPGNGNITFQAEVDPSNIVRPEVSESNNRAQATINLQPGGHCLTLSGPTNEETGAEDIANGEGQLKISAC